MPDPGDPARKLSLRQIQQRIGELPLLSGVVFELMKLDSDADEYFDRVVALVSGDPGFAAKLLQFANSAHVAAPAPIVTLKAALMRVGAKGAVDLVLASSAAHIFIPRHDWEHELWHHAISVACIARALSAHVQDGRIDADKAYLFGLLHDVGRFVLYLEAPEELRDVDETQWSTPSELIEHERAICGFDHAELGYLAMQRWQLSREIALGVRHHHSPFAIPDEVPAPVRAMIRLVWIADSLAVALALRSDLWREMPAADLQKMIEKHCRTVLSLPANRVVPLVTDALELGGQMVRSLGLGGGRRGAAGDGAN